MEQRLVVRDKNKYMSLHIEILPVFYVLPETKNKVTMTKIYFRDK